MSGPIHATLTRDAIREGCALVIVAAFVDGCGNVHEAGQRLTALDTVTTADNLHESTVDTEWGPIEIRLLAIDPTRPSGQWALGMWLREQDGDANDRAGYPPTDFAIFVLDALTGTADHAELRRVVVALAGGER